MNLQNDSQSLALMKFGIGQPVPRTDPLHIVGRAHDCCSHTTSPSPFRSFFRRFATRSKPSKTSSSST